MKTVCPWILWSFAGLVFSGCAHMNNSQSGALAGTGLGAVAGAIVGGATGHPGAGALVGGATGAVAGGLVGSAEDAREERDVAVAHAQYESARNQAMSRAVTEAEIVNMTRNRVSEDLIVNSIRTRGCLWDGSPDSVIRLKEAGVSDRVVATMQTTGLRVAGTPAPVYYMPPPAPGVVVVAPGYYRHHPRYYRRW